MFFLYVLRNPQGRLYVGFTEDIERRVKQHQENQGGWTRGKGPWELAYHEVFASRDEALRRERNLKRGEQNQELRNRLGPEAQKRRPSG